MKKILNATFICLLLALTLFGISEVDGQILLEKEWRYISLAPSNLTTAYAAHILPYVGGHNNDDLRISVGSASLNTPVVAECFNAYQMTLELWMRLNFVPGADGQVHLICSNVAGSNSITSYIFSNGMLYWRVADKDGTVHYVNYDISGWNAGEPWHHVVLTIDFPEDVIALYTDGVLRDDTASIALSSDSIDAIESDTHLGSDSTIANQFSGSILYNLSSRIYTTAEVTAAYAAGAGAADPTLVVDEYTLAMGETGFGEKDTGVVFTSAGQSVTATDSGGNVTVVISDVEDRAYNDAGEVSLQDGTGFQASGPVLINGSPSGSAVDLHSGIAFTKLDGNSQFHYRTDADFPESGITGVNDVTIELWVNPTAYNENPLALVSKYLSAGDKRMYSLLIDENWIVFWVSSDGTIGNTSVSFPTNATIVPGEWQHIAVVYDASGGTVDFYQDGIFLEQIGGQEVSIADKDPPFEIGSSNSGNFFEGGIFNVALHDAMVPAADIKAAADDWDYDHSGEANIIGTWLFDEAADVDYIDNREGNAGGDMIPYDAGDVTFNTLRSVDGGYVQDIEKVGVSADFDTQYGANGGNILNITTQDYEIDFWFRQDAAPGDTAAIIGKRTGPTWGDVGWCVYLHSNGNIYCRADDNTNEGMFTYDLSANGYLDNRWHHVWAFHDRSAIGTCEIKIDGITVTPATSGIFPVLTLTNAVDFGIGDIGTKEWEGNLRDVRLKIGGTKTSATEVLYRATHPFDYSASSWTLDGTREAWEFSRNSSTTVPSIVTLITNNLTLSSVGAWSQGAFLSNIIWIDGNEENGGIGGLTPRQMEVFADINGLTQYYYRNDADFPESGITGANNFTIEAFINPAIMTSADMLIVSKYETAGDLRMYAWGVDEGVLFLWISSDGTAGNTSNSFTSTAPVIAGKWQHVAVVYTAAAGTVDFFYNGEFLEQVGGAEVTIADKNPDFRVGRLDGAVRYYNGRISNVSFFDDVRTAPEISYDAAHPEADLSGEGNIIAQWLFTDAAASNFIDNTETDAGRDLIPNDGGDVTFGACGRTEGSIPLGSMLYPSTDSWTISKDGATVHSDVQAGKFVSVAADDGDESTLLSTILENEGKYILKHWIKSEAIHDGSQIFLDVDGDTTPLLSKEIGKSLGDNGEFARSMDFGGTITATGGDVLDIALEDYEISFRFRLGTAPVATTAILGKQDAPGGGLGWVIYLHENDSIRVRANDLTDDANFQVTGANMVGYYDGKWHHVYAFADRSDISSCTIYIDGTNMPTSTAGTFPVLTLANGFDFTISGDDGGGNPFVGELCDVKIHIGGTMATVPQITYQYLNPFDYSVNSWTLDGTRDYWKMWDNAANATIAGATNDLTASANTNTFATYQWKYYEVCWEGIGRSFDIDETYYAPAANNGIHDVELEDIGAWAWVKINSTSSTTERFFSKWVEGTTPYYVFGLANGVIRFKMADSDPDSYEMKGNTDIRDGEWHFVAVVIDRSNTANCKMYLDGVEDGATVKIGTLADVDTITTTATFTMGADSTGTNALDGRMAISGIAIVADIMGAGEMGAEGEIQKLFHYPTNPTEWSNSEDYWICNDFLSDTVVVGDNNNLVASANTDLFSVTDVPMQTGPVSVNLSITGAGPGTNSCTVYTDDSVIRQNLADNPGIEGNADPPDGWTQEDSATVISDTSPHSGTYCLKATAGAANVGASQNITFVSGKYYTVAGWAKATVGDTATVTMDKGDTTLTTIGTVTAADWTKVQASFLSTGTAGVLYLRGTVNGDIVWFDDFDIQEKDEADAAVDAKGDGLVPINMADVLPR